MTGHSPQSKRSTSSDTDVISIGNAAETGRDSAGWFVGSFLSEGAGIRCTGAVQVKWGVHNAGEVRIGLNNDTGVYSLAVLVSGRFVIEFPRLDEDVMLSQPGDYVLYGPGVGHGWRALGDSTVLTVRWSVPENE